MIWLVAGLAALIVLPWLGRLYFSTMARHARDSVPVWERLVKGASQLIDDESVPDIVADFAYDVANTAGSGRLAKRLLADVITGRMDQKATTGGHTDLANAISELSVEQRRLFSHMLADALLFDSYQVPVRGIVLRRALWWVYTVSAKRDAYMPPEQMKDVAVAAEKVVRAQAEEKVLATVGC